MADDSLRALARRFRETGDPADEAAWLRERVRSGELDPVQLELAAYLGHEPAHLAGAAARAPTWDQVFQQQLRRVQDPGKATLLTRRRYPLVWLQAAGPPAQAVLTRIAIATAWLLLKAPLMVIPTHEDLAAHSLAEQTLRTAEAWLLAPEDSEDARLRCVLAGDAASQHRGGLTDERTRTWYQLDVTACAAYTAGSLTLADGAEYVARALANTGQALGEGLSEGLAPQVLAAIQAELVPWALGGEPPAPR